MRKLVFFSMLCFLPSCTVSFTTTLTSAEQASDIVDEQQTASPNMQASVPLR